MFERLLQRFFTHDELGWRAYDEVFLRYNIFKCRRFNLYLHKIDAPRELPECHDHPWWFITCILRNGYLEKVGDVLTRQRPGKIMYRPANHLHSVTTPYGTSWTLVLTGPWSREWSVRACKE